MSNYGENESRHILVGFLWFGINPVIKGCLGIWAVFKVLHVPIHKIVDWYHLKTINIMAGTS